MNEPTRGGTRGGKDQFKWEDVQHMSYKERELYLGFSDKLGFYDKAGKWKKTDWWNQKSSNSQSLSKEEELRLK